MPEMVFDLHDLRKTPIKEAAATVNRAIRHANVSGLPVSISGKYDNGQQTARVRLVGGWNFGGQGDTDGSCQELKFSPV